MVINMDYTLYVHMSIPDVFQVPNHLCTVDSHSNLKVSKILHEIFKYPLSLIVVVVGWQAGWLGWRYPSLVRVWSQGGPGGGRLVCTVCALAPSISSPGPLGPAWAMLSNLVQGGCLSRDHGTLRNEGAAVATPALKCDSVSLMNTPEPPNS